MQHLDDAVRLESVHTEQEERKEGVCVTGCTEKNHIFRMQKEERRRETEEAHAALAIISRRLALTPSLPSRRTEGPPTLSAYSEENEGTVETRFARLWSGHGSCVLALLHAHKCHDRKTKRKERIAAGFPRRRVNVNMG